MAAPLILGALLGAGASLFGGAGKRRAARAQAEAAELNAEQVEQSAEIRTTLREREGAREVGTIQANAGASGVEIAGSAEAIIRESARNTAFDVSSIGSQSALEAKALRRGAKASRAGGNLAFLGSAFTAGSILAGG